MQFSFADSQEVQDLNAVPEQFRPLYGEKDGGGFTLKTANPAVKGAVEAIVGMDKALKTTRSERDAALKRVVDLGPLSDYGTTPDEIAAAVKAKLDEATAALAAGAKINPDKIKQEVAAQFARESAGKDAQITELTGQLQGMLVDQGLTSAAVDKDVDADPELFAALVRPQVRMVVKDGKRFAAVVDKDGEVRYSGLTGLPMTIKELGMELKAAGKHARIFNSNANNGSGSEQTAQRRPASTTMTQKQADQMSSVDKISLGLRKGQAVSRRTGQVER